MIKMIISSLLFFSSLSAMACYGEAQITAKIDSVQTDSLMSCKVFIDSKQIQFFASSGVCPLEISEILSKGIEVGIINGHDCRLDNGMTMSGIVVKSASGDLSFE